ncbi:MAG: aldo/keto reductase, partial [Candidatus Eisenbacteria bacterium]|nr:aldo/keto reductase [Candidatus Eisenbacteria bacterium]
LGLVSEQSLYNLAVRTIELEIIPACRALGVSVLPWSPLYGGMLGGLEANEGRRTTEIVQKRIESRRPQLEAYEAFCREIGERPADVALAWLLQDPTVASPILGPRTMQQLEDSLRAIEVDLSDDALAKLDEIWPGPGGQAPEAYAW